MNSEIKKILEDIYIIAPELKGSEDEIVEIISNMLKNRPQIEPDDAFVEKLRGILSEQIRGKKVFNNDREVNFLSLYKKIIFSSAALFSVLIIAIFSLQDKNVFNDLKDSGYYSSGVKVSRLEDRAFGILYGSSERLNDSSQQISVNGDYNTDNTYTESIKGPDSIYSIGGGGVTTVGSNTSYEESIDIDYPYYTSYKYVYKGGDFTQENESMEVLKRVVDDDWNDKISSSLKDMRFGVLETANLNNIKFNNINFSEDVDFGYRISIDFTYDTISIYKNWEKWPDDYSNCFDGSCYDSLGLKYSDVSSQEDVIYNIENFFLKHHIDISAYGEPSVNFDQGVYGSEKYISNEVVVSYPLEINNKKVYESYGGYYGITVSYDLKNDRVSGVSNLMSQNYQSSYYPVVTDVNRIVDFAENKDNYREIEGASIEEIYLDTPFVSYVKYWQYNDNGQSEYIVPAFIFPVINGDDFYRENIVVPLVEDFWQDSEYYLMRSSENYK